MTSMPAIGPIEVDLTPRYLNVNIVDSGPSGSISLDKLAETLREYVGNRGGEESIHVLLHYEDENGEIHKWSKLYE